MDGYLKCAILDSLFHKVVNTTSDPIGEGLGGWGVVGSHKVAELSKTKINTTSDPIGEGATKWQNFPIQKPFMIKWLRFRLFLVPHVTKCSYSVH